MKRKALFISPMGLVGNDKIKILFVRLASHVHSHGQIKKQQNNNQQIELDVFSDLIESGRSYPKKNHMERWSFVSANSDVKRFSHFEYSWLVVIRDCEAALPAYSIAFNH